MEKKKVILITRRYPYGTAEAFLESEIQYLSREFDEIVVFPSEKFGEIRKVPENVLVNTTFSSAFKNMKERFFVSFYSKSLWKSIWKYRKEIKKLSDIILVYRYMSGFLLTKKYFSLMPELLNGNIVYTYWFNALTHALVSLKDKDDFTFSIVSRVHRYDLYEGLDSTQKFWPYRKEVLLNIDRLYSISDDGKFYLEKKYQVLNKIVVSKLGVFDNFRISTGSVDNCVSIISVSRIEPLKRVDLIFRLIYVFSLEKPDMNVRWTHFGDGSEMTFLKSNIDSMDKLQNLEINLMGSVKNEEVYRYYTENKIDVFINLSSSEGIPVSIMEAQSYGIPVLATNVGGSGEIVTHEVGCLVDVDDEINKLKEKLTVLIDRKLDREEIKKVWASRYDADKNYKDFVLSLKTL
ncbi:glycosyltransferase [Echinicola sp. 20G]|uniref:glycosyltransferase n=1 Tax=Echinicola sp. 20G TaxID=2781961 RepID=UPI0019105400|nr:glycosyltransferase [Echinicola sp. 20G]